MSFRKWVVLLLVVFGHAFVAADELSQEFANLMAKGNSTLASDSPLYQNYKKLYKELENSKKKLLEIREDFHNRLRKMPHAYLICAMEFMKFGRAKIFHDVTGVGNLILHPMYAIRQWPARIPKIRIDYDKYDEENPCLMYPSSSSHKIEKKEDNTSYSQWLQFVTENPGNLAFEKTKKYHYDFEEWQWDEIEDKWRMVAIYLQGNLTKYYNQLDETERLERYNNDKKVFLENFSAIIQRGFRLSCYFFEDFQPQLDEELRKTYHNGTNIFLESAILRVHPTWYFPQEHIDMYNILINSTTSDSDNIRHMFASVNVTMSNAPFILPGMDPPFRTGYGDQHLKYRNNNIGLQEFATKTG